MGLINANKRRATFVIVLGIGLGCISGPTAGQLKPCSEAAPTTDSYSVQADDILVTPKESPEETLLNQTWFTIRNNFKTVRLESPKELCLLRCDARRPAGEQDFPPTLAATLDQDNVILEVWGGIERAGQGGTMFHSARFQYALIPMCAHPAPGTVAHGVYMFQVDTKPGQSMEETLRQLDQSELMRALLSMATGLKLARIDHFDDAWAFLCQGYLTLKHFVGASPSTQDKRLLDYVMRSAVDLAERARKSSEDSNLKHLPKEDLALIWSQP